MTGTWLEVLVRETAKLIRAAENDWASCARLTAFLCVTTVCAAALMWVNHH